MTQPTTDTSREAVHRSCNQSDLGHLSDQLLSDVCRALLAERDALRDQLAAARNEALEEVKRSMMGFAHEHADHWSEEFAQGAETQTIGLIGVVDALKSTTPAPHCDICGDSGSVSTFDIDQNGEHIEIACPECTASSPHQIDRVSLADIEGYGTNSTPAPRGLTFPEDLQVSPSTNPLPDTCIHMTSDMAETCPHCNPGGPAPREVTVQEALDADKILAAANTAIQGYVDGRDSYARGVQAGISRMSEALRALANEEQSDG